MLVYPPDRQLSVGTSFPNAPTAMKTPRSIACGIAFLPLILLPSCQDPAARMGKGFRLPEGDAGRGQAAFVELNCHQCHSVAGVEMPASKGAPGGIAYELGGEVRLVKSYGQLVTAIIQPQHIVSESYLQQIEKSRSEGVASPMPNYNSLMTVAQLTDIVTFLHAHYQKAPPPGMSYPYYLP